MSQVFEAMSSYLRELYREFRGRAVPVIAAKPGYFGEAKTSIGTAFPVANVGNGTLFATASHVVKGFSEVYLLIQNERETALIPAETVIAVWQMANNIFDFALLYADKVQLQPLNLGNSLAVVPGDMVFTLGYPLGIVREPTIVYGNISASDLDIRTELGIMHGIMQTTLPLNPGFSGSPILDVNKNVIGISRAIVVGAQLMSYATPINFVKPFIKSMVTSGKIAYPSLNIIMFQYNPLLKRLYEYEMPQVAQCINALKPRTIVSIITISENPSIPPCSAVLNVSVGYITINNPTPAQVLQALYEAYWQGVPLTMTLQTPAGVVTVQPQYTLKTL